MSVTLQGFDPIFKPFHKIPRHIWTFPHYGCGTEVICNFTRSTKTSHHLHQILLHSHQHLLPTRSALRYDDHFDLPNTMELNCPGGK